MMRPRIWFLNRAAVAKGRIDGYTLDPAYVAACRWFHCGLIDRTRRLHVGFPYRPIDPIPPPDDVGTFGQTADATGERLLRESTSSGRGIQVLWSGGIDSTVALIALLKAATTKRLQSRLQVVCSKHSVDEYPRFFHEHIVGKLDCSLIAGPVGDSLDDSRLIVTGEHGDQLFGSAKLQPIVELGEAQRPYESALARLISDELGDPVRADRIIELLQPQVEAAPVPLTTVFDYLWWVNFSLKWQHVTLRLSIFRGHRFSATYSALRHFFRGRAFQRWALTNPEIRRCEDWSTYKQTAKSYILEFTGDRDYFLNKRKEPSLQNVSVDRNAPPPFRTRVVWYVGQRPRFEPVAPKRPVP